MATFRQIKHMSSGLDDEQLTQPHIKKLAHDIVDFGYRGAPILYIPQVAIIDGHDRLAALCLIDKLIMNARNWTPDFEAALMMLNKQEIAEDVTDIVYKYMLDHDCQEYEDLPIGHLGDMFEGTRIEEYKKYIKQW